MGNKQSFDPMGPLPTARLSTNGSAPPSPTADATSSNSAPSAPVARSPSRGQSSDEAISNWKLFNDLENREEADVLELSLFLDALTKYMPGMEEERRRNSASQASDGELESTPPPPAPTLAKTVSEQVVGQIDIANMYIQSAELGKTITLDAVKDLIESCKKGQKIPRQVIIRVVNQAIALFRQEPTLVEVAIAPANHITVIGDLHGQLDDLLLIFRENGLPSESNPYVFNGDFVDRGDRGVEIAIIIYLFKILYPKHVWVNRGNHEEFSITQVFGFMKECETKYDRFIFDLFCESFRWLPLATLLDSRVLVVHGGVPRDLVPLKELNALDRTEYDLTRWREKPRHKIQKEPHRRMQMMRDVLWSDPRPAKGWEENKRGAGILYGPDVVQKFMSKNKLALIIRSHECVPRGFDWPYQDKGMLVTLFSASNYCGKANNLGCFVRIPSSKQAKPAFFQYMASAESRDMAVSNLDGLFSLIIEHKEDLMEAFLNEDKEKTGKLKIATWSQIMEDVLDLALDWPALQPLLTSVKDGSVPYEDFLARYNAAGSADAAAATEKSEDPERAKRRAAFNSLYRHRTRLEALFRVLDRDGNGTITLDELEASIKLLNERLPPGMQAFSAKAIDIMRMFDFSHDNEININEFMEGFRINAKLTVAAKWKRARKKIKALSALGALKALSHLEPEESARPAETPSVSDVDDAAVADEVHRKLTRVPSARRAPVLTRHGSIQLIGLAADLDVPADEGQLMSIQDANEGEGEEDDEEAAVVVKDLSALTRQASDHVGSGDVTIEKEP
ncbi:hypothetical protein ATCC90586_007184 [Pythium insidiosum]|nr:hypothetical protein ATCC90586_007184 [Pythium insidiosum]